MKDKKKSITVGVQELSPSEIKRREAEYWKDVRDFGRGLIAGERFKKDGIIKLAKDLEKAGTIETHKISIRIKSDLKDIIDKRLLAAEYIHMSLDDKYKRSVSKPKQNENNFVSNQNQSTETRITTEISESQNEATTTEQQEQSSQKTKEIQKHDTLAQEILAYSLALTQKITDCSEDEIRRFSDNRVLASETKTYRFDLTKRFSELNLKTVYDFSKMLSIVLDDFIEQLDDELESRRKKQVLTSE